MHPLTPSMEARDACTSLGNLISGDINANRFGSSILRLQRHFEIYDSTCPKPVISPGLIVIPEVRIQSELYLPIADITAVFNRLYSAALTYPPILSSTPFHNSMSWADTFVELTQYVQFNANPALLLEKLLTNRELLIDFLFASFLPRRFYGGLGRYPVQQKFVREWLKTVRAGTLQCLDAACGTGEETYGLALLLSEEGLSPEEVRIVGWTLEPLEVWAATHCRFPHNPRREALLRESAAALFRRGYDRCISFSCQDILTLPTPPLPSLYNRGGGTGEKRMFDLIICNGLLGGPVMHDRGHLDRAAGNLAQLLSPGGILLAADRFHGGWKRKCPQNELRASFEAHGLLYVDTGEGVGGLKPD